MINIFDDLKEVGFDNLGKVDLFPPKAEISEKEKELNKKRLTIEEVLYDKTYVCPVCNKEFKTKAIRSGKNRLLTVDLDLKANYDVANPLLYECIVCEECGYAALSKNFNVLTTSQIRWIKEQICTRYKVHHYPPILTEKDGVLRFKLALLNSYVKKAKDGEKGYICLKLAWLYRDMKEKALEELFLQHALTGFENAYNNERFPIFELGELTTAYIIADIHRRMKNYDKAMQWVGFVVMDRSVSLRLKTKALHLKGVISEEKRNAEENKIE
ncbi:MAG: DUF2225 domain-containing protein [Cellulosilyticum sp.]|nr:DUF2225 domain-containing protein [Cellulosilyticum sp.]